MVNLRHDEGLANPRINSQDLDGADHTRETQRGFAKAKVRVPQLTSHSSHSLVERSLGDCGQVKRTVEGGSRDS